MRVRNTDTPRRTKKKRLPRPKKKDHMKPISKALRVEKELERRLIENWRRESMK